jgi:hypothetical protein
VNTAAITLCAASGAISRCDALTRTRYIPMPVDRARELFDDKRSGCKARGGRTPRRAPQHGARGA